MQIGCAQNMGKRRKMENIETVGWSELIRRVYEKEEMDPLRLMEQIMKGIFDLMMNVREDLNLEGVPMFCSSILLRYTSLLDPELSRKMLNFMITQLSEVQKKFDRMDEMRAKEEENKNE